AYVHDTTPSPDYDYNATFDYSFYSNSSSEDLETFLKRIENEGRNEELDISHTDPVSTATSPRTKAEALESLLEGDGENQIALDKRASIIPRCDVGERCALKHGPRIGRLCDCMRGSACNTFFLRCY
ncbi:cocaine- and amphetamine-regulated transcript protein-like, partial [Clarias magur]